MPVFYVTVDSSGVVTGITKAKKSAEELGKTFDDMQRKGGEATDKLAVSLNSMGKKGSKSLDAVALSTKRMAAIAFGVLGTYVALSNSVRECFKYAAEYETLGVVLQQVGQVAGYSAIEIDENVNALRRMGIAGIEARKTMTQLLQSGMDITKTPKLARVAQDAAVIGGINSSEAFERMVHGIQSAQTDVLRGIGLNVNFEQAYSKYATNIGKTVDQLSEQERVQARVNAVMESGESITGAYEAAMGTLGKQMSSVSRVQQDFATDAGYLLVELAKASGVIETYTRSIESLNKAVLVKRGKELGFTEGELEALGNNIPALRGFVEAGKSAKDEIERLLAVLTVLEKKGIDTSEMRVDLEKQQKSFYGVREEIRKLEEELAEAEAINANAWGNAWNDNKVEELTRRLEELRAEANLGTEAIKTLRETIASWLSIGTSMNTGGPSAHVDAWQKDMEGRATRIAQAFAKTDEARRVALEAARKQAEEDNKILQTPESKAVLDKAIKDLESFKKRGTGGSSGAREQANAIKVINDEIARLTMSEKEYTQHKIDEKIAEWERLGISAEKMAEYQEALSKGKSKEKFDEANKAIQELSRQYAASFKDQESATKAITADMDQYRQAIVAAFTEGSVEAEKFLAMLDRLEGRMLEEASHDWGDGARRALRSYSEEAANAGKNMENAIQGSLSTLEDGLVNFATTGKLEISSMVDSIIADFARLAIRQSITGPLVGGLSSAIGGLFGGGSSISTSMSNPFLDKIAINTPSLGSLSVHAKGGIFPSDTGLSAYTNSIVASPTLFAFAKGGIPNMGLMGEAGAEAILPLTRTSSGDLGVRAEGMSGGTSVEVYVNVENHSNAQVSAQRRVDNRGNVFIDMQIIDQIDSAMAQKVANGNSQTARAMDRTRNLSPNSAAYRR